MLNGLLDQVLVPSWLPTSGTSSAADHLRANPVAEDGMGNNKKKKRCTETTDNYDSPLNHRKSSLPATDNS